MARITLPFLTMLSLCITFFGEYYTDYVLQSHCSGKNENRERRKLFVLINVVSFWHTRRQQERERKKGDNNINKINSRYIVSTFLQHHAITTGCQLECGNVLKRRERINCDVFNESMHRLKTTWNVFSCFTVRSESDYCNTFYNGYNVHVQKPYRI